MFSRDPGKDVVLVGRKVNDTELPIVFRFDLHILHIHCKIFRLHFSFHYYTPSYTSDDKKLYDCIYHLDIYGLTEISHFLLKRLKNLLDDQTFVHLLVLRASLSLKPFKVVPVHLSSI